MHITLIYIYKNKYNLDSLHIPNQEYNPNGPLEINAPVFNLIISLMLILMPNLYILHIQLISLHMKHNLIIMDEISVFKFFKH